MYTGACAFLSFFLSLFLALFRSLVYVSNSPPHRERSCARDHTLSLSALLFSTLVTRIPDNARCTSGPMQTRPIHWATCSYIGGGDVEQKRAERSVTDASLWFNEWVRSIDPRDSAAVHPVIILPLLVRVTSLSLCSFLFLLGCSGSS